MTVENFRCSHCGKFVGAAAELTDRVRCSHCGRWVPIPPVVASLPHPHVPADRSDGPALQMQPAANDADALPRRGPVTTALERSMPLLTSVFFHVGLALIMIFVTIISVKVVPAGLVEPPDWTPRDIDVNYAAMTPASNTLREQKRPDRMRRRASDEAVLLDRRKMDERLVIGLGTPAGGGWDLGPRGGGGLGAEFMTIVCPGSNPAYQIVYVIDRSGSMIDTFDAVSRELINSIARLRPEQDFHVILFNDGPPTENPPRRLVPATRDNKRDVANFLDGVVASSRTDPVPALERAFAVLRQADSRRKGKVIFLLTDAEFPDSEKVLRVVARLNRDKQVRINTFLYGYRPPHAEQVMTKIAADNGGQYRFVPAGR